MSNHQQPGRAATTSDQLAGEPARWFERFSLYCQQGPQRSLIGTYRAIAHKPRAASLPSGWKAAAAKFRWADRARDYDRRAHEADEQGRIDAIRQGAADRAKVREGRKLLAEESEWQLRTALLEKARTMLDSALYRRETSEDGKTIKVLPAKWSFRSAVEMIALACKLGRLSARMPPIAEAEPTAELGESFFFTSGELEIALPPGSVPEMPVDANVVPPIGNMKLRAGRDGAPTQPAIELPRGTR